MNYSALKDIFPGASTKELKIDVDPDWTQFNPSISFGPEGYRCIIRSSNYSMNDLGQYLTHDPHNVIRTKNYIATLDSELDIVDVQQIKPCKWGPIKYTQVRGLEDARLYWANDHWQVYGNLREHRIDGLPTIVTARLDHDALVDPEIYENFDRVQKNWSNLEGSRDFIDLCNPAAVMRNGITYEERPWILSEDSKEFRGGSQAIRYEDFYVSVIHQVDWETGHRRYFHRFCMFNNNGYLMEFTPPFYFVFDEVLTDVPMIEYAAGLVTHGGDFIASLGFKDSRAFLARVPISQVLSAMRPANR